MDFSSKYKICTGGIKHIFIGFFLLKLRLRIPKVGIIRNEIYFFWFLSMCKNELILPMGFNQFVSDSPEFTHR